MVTKTNRSRRQRKKESVRAHIIATAVQLFSRHGMNSVTVDHIADVADIGKGTIYNYFDTKEDIVVAFMANVEREVQSQIPKFQTQKGSLSSILTEFIRFQFRKKKRHHAFVRVFLAQMFLRTEQFLPHLVEMQKAIDGPLEALFGGLRERGMLRRDVDLAEAIMVFKTMHLGLTALWAIEGPPFRGTEMVLEQEMKLFCEGLEADKS
ncbi:MAG TPA: TetR/AcrR family transcriptional regulator [Candidatus Acidoferrum sp.]|jgi:TetR/AcrR family fatty acid metabolism transcriptional regulator